MPSCAIPENGCMALRHPKGRCVLQGARPIIDCARAKGEDMQVIEEGFYAFSKDNAPCATAQPGEMLKFVTKDCFSNRIPDEKTTMADLDYTYGFANPAAGPVYIEGAEPGDVLVVDIYEIEVADEGTVATDDHCGPLFEGTDYRTKKIKIKDGVADFNGVKILINPMIGVIGTAPAGEDVIDGFVGSHGGNMDNKLITKGTRLYLPVRVQVHCCRWASASPWATANCAAGIEIPAEMPVRFSWSRTSSFIARS
ncbi:MAG: acetamidase/formamidase family protein [Slackia sp.]